MTAAEKRALAKPNVRQALNGLVGCPEGWWPETRQAMLRIADEVPKGVSTFGLVDATMVVDHAGRYQWKVAP